MGWAATASVAAAAAAIVAALALDHPLITRADLRRWVDRTPPARLLRGRSPRRRAAVACLFASAGLALLGSGLGIFGGNLWWAGNIGGSIFIFSLMCVDVSQFIDRDLHSGMHRQEGARPTR